MSTLLKRWLIYLFIPAGIVLLFLPLNTYRTEEVEKDFVFLKISESLIEETAVKAMPVVPDEPDEENLLQYVNELQKVLSGEQLSVATTINQSGYPVIQKQMLAAYPALLEHIDHVLRMGHWSEGQISSSRMDDEQVNEEWLAFKKAFLGDINGANFQYGDQIVKELVKSGYSSIRVEIEYLKIAYKMTGGIFLFLGLLAWRGTYAPPSEGIQIGKRSGMITWDVIIVGVGTIFTWWFLDSLLAKYFHTVPVWGDDKQAFFMGLYWITLGNLIMALFTTATSLQVLKITRENITVKGLFGQKTLAWSDVENIQVAEFFSPRKVSGVFAPRKVGKTLTIQGTSSTLYIMEPPFSSTKKKVLSTLAEYAPKELQQTILELSKKWLSVW